VAIHYLLLYVTSHILRASVCYFINYVFWDVTSYAVRSSGCYWTHFTDLWMLVAIHYLLLDITGHALRVPVSYLSR
jgi:hypothetical protein